MMLLQRAPREVYRVYGEEEFFARADRDQRVEPTGATGEPRLRRAAGVTVLLVAAGAVGGLIAITSLSAATGARRRPGARLLATTGSPVSPRAAAHVSRAYPSVGALPRPSVRRHDVAQHARRVALAHHGGTPRRAAASRRAPVSKGSPELAVREQSTPVFAATPAQPVSPVASASATAQRVDQSEFGFER